MKRFSLPALLAIITFGVTAVCITKGKNNTYAIQNVQTGKNLRPFEASKSDGNKIILYNHHNWKCLTWEFIQIEKEVYKLKNKYTSKTFQPISKPEAGVGLWQQPLKNDSLQEWEFIEQADETYLIRLKGTELYITASSGETDSPIILIAKSDDKKQLWKKVRQTPWI